MGNGSNQKQAFLEAEGDAYFRRNQGKGNAEDPILQIIDRFKLRGNSILEIGCGSGERLLALHKRPDTECFGIDPSKAAIDAAQRDHPELIVEVGTADQLPYPADRFDLVIFGFCLYLVDPVDYFSVAREADRVLKNRGTLMIHDFCTPAAYSNTYVHREGIVTRKMEWNRMFTWNPSYSLVHRELVARDGEQLRDVDTRVTVDVLVKDAGTAFPLSR